METWDEKFMSPVCSAWFKNQELAPEYTTFSELSLSRGALMNQSKLAACAPVFNPIDSLNTSESFYGTICADSSPIKDIGK